MSGPILRTKRLKILEPLQEADADEILVRNSETKEVSSLPKESVFDADNIKTEIAIDAPVDPTAEGFADAINALPLFTIDGKTIPTFKAVTTGENPVVYYVELLNLGKGSYGLTGTQLTIANLKITTVEPTSKDIADVSSTQIIDLGNQGDDVVTAMNRQMPNITIQDQNDGYTIVKGIFLNGQFHEYLWIGTAGTYGRDVLQTTDQDFKELSSVSQGVARATDNYSGTVKTDVYKEYPTVYVKETIDQMFAGLGNVITTVKPILSTALATQNVAGFVTYINALNPVLVVQASEIVKYNLTDTGRVFELNLRGRSFGAGQPAIVAANVLEITDFLNKDIKLSNYPNTRNDGQLPTNKVLSPDANGNLKMYTIAVAPAPFIKELIPDSYLPDTTGNIRILGDFFTPQMCDRINNQNAIIIGGVATIHYADFVNSQEILANVTTGSAEGSFSITLNNGLETIKTNALLIVLGTVFKPEPADWINIVEPINFESGKVLVQNFGSQGYAKWNKICDVSKNFEIRYNATPSPLGEIATGGTTVPAIAIRSVFDDRDILWTKYAFNKTTDFYVGDVFTRSAFDFNQTPFQQIKFRYINGIWTLYHGNTLVWTGSGSENNLTHNVYIFFGVKNADFENIRYIELAS